LLVQGSDTKLDNDNDGCGGGGDTDDDEITYRFFMI